MSATPEKIQGLLRKREQARLVQDWGIYRACTVDLMRCGYVDPPLEAPPVAVETTVADPPLETVVKRGPGRPRKAGV